MPLSFDTRYLPDDKREKLADTLRRQKDFKLPHLQAWNYELCRQHRHGWVEEYVNPDTRRVNKRTVTTRPKPGCRKCGIHLAKHQRVAAAWMYMKKRALLADTMGAGKTASIAGFLALLAETGELGTLRESVGRAIIVPRAAALAQWQDELNRMLPGLRIAVAEGAKSKRVQTYAGVWDILLIGPEMLRNDGELLQRIRLAAFVTDDIDQLRNPNTSTSYWCDKIGGMADRYIIATGTPLQKRLPELHAVLDGIGGLQVFGPMDSFIRRHVIYSSFADSDGSFNKTIQGYRNLAAVKKQMAPMVLRRTAKDIDDIHMPAIVPDDIYLELYPEQRAKYKELQQGVITLLKEEKMQVKHTTALSKIHYGSAICAGLSTLGDEDGAGKSVKYDWVIDKVSPWGDLGDEKVVVFTNLTKSVEALQRRFEEAGLKYVTVWGKDPNKNNRRKAQTQFWEDPKTRILIGTRAIEQSLNLQVSRHLINVDMILNPARMEQLAGRIRRAGSAYNHVYVHNLLAKDTQEERYVKLLEKEAALSGHIWDENSELFKLLDAKEMLKLISGR